MIGYGKLGRSIAAMLHAKHVGVTVFDCDPIRRTQALSQGFRTRPALAGGGYGAGVHEVPADFRQSIAAAWLAYFDGGTSGGYC